MRKIKAIGWVFGLSIVGVVLSTDPASAQLNHAATATNVSNNTAIRYGFEPIANNPEVSTSLQAAINAINELVGSPEASAGGSEISPNTRTALLALLDRLQEIEGNLWTDGNELDQSIQDAANELARELADAQTNCQSGAEPRDNLATTDTPDDLGCQRLNTLVKRISGFVTNLEALRNRLIESGQEERLY